MMPPLPLWNDKITGLKPAKGPEWAKEFAGAIDELVSGKMQIATINPPSKFTFNKALFATMLAAIPPSPDPVSGKALMAAAWEAAMLTSMMVVTPGSYLGAPTPPTTFSVVALTIVDPVSVAAAKALLLTMLIASVPVPDAKASTLPLAFFSAFKLITCTVTGMNSLVPPAGPTPLPAPFQPVL